MHTETPVYIKVLPLASVLFLVWIGINLFGKESVRDKQIMIDGQNKTLDNMAVNLSDLQSQLSAAHEIDFADRDDSIAATLEEVGNTFDSVDQKLTEIESRLDQTIYRNEASIARMEALLK